MTRRRRHTPLSIAGRLIAMAAVIALICLVMVGVGAMLAYCSDRLIGPR